ncbi:2Fe-2S iron-sulfur cluster-binding protein [Kitasatospora sp. NPDC056327]|uniref:2Fe-2S iron-sulfur cluster-binding protein n=1 Tax=Kitasatospora sp. NPDC056327 TaxID=3345785 RepID=UPI0035E34A52
MTTDHPIEALDAGLLDHVHDHAPQVGRELRPTTSYTLRVNGFERPVSEAWIGESLLYVLRERLGLAGAKDGCEQGECGACSVQVDGQLVAGCLVPAALAQDSEINTVEGLSAGGGASDVQQALAESGAVQCGYCVPGLAMAVHDLLQRNHRPTDVEARQALCGNLCRCTGYRGALAAVQAVADARAAESPAAGETAAAEAPAPAAPARAAATGPAPAPAADPTDAGAAADLPPVYTDDDAWTEHVPQQPAGQPGPAAGGTDASYGVPDGHGGYDSGVYDTTVLAPVRDVPGQQTGPDGSTGFYPAPGHPGQQQPYPGATPAHGTYLPGAGGYPDANGYPQQNGYDPGSAYDGPVYETPVAATPAHGTPVPGYDAAGHPQPGGHDGGTPAHGTPYVPAPAHGGPAGGSAPAGVPYGATPAHGIRLPEDDHAS